MLVRLIQDKRVPKSSYLRESARRVTLDEKYKLDIKVKNEKDKQRQRYVNIQRGARF